MLREPFIHLFRTKRHPYVYDVNSNDIMRLDTLSYKLLSLIMKRSGESDIFESLATEYEKSEIQARIDVFREAQDKHYAFSSNRPGRILYCNREHLEETYNKYIEQIVLEVTEGCNMACSYCAYSDLYPENRNPSGKSMRWEVARMAIDMALKHGGQRRDIFVDRLEDTRDFSIGFYGGEPLLEWELIERCCSYCKERLEPGRKARYTITTNGTLLTRELCKALIDNDVNLVISMDGPTETHDRMRVFPDGGGTHKKVIEGIERYNAAVADKSPEMPLSAMINCVLTGNTDLREILDYFVELEELLNNDYVHYIIKIGGMSGGIQLWNECHPERHLEEIAGAEELFSEYVDACLAGIYRPSSDNQVVSWRLRLLDEMFRSRLFFDLYNRTRHQFDEEFMLRELGHPGSICLLGGRKMFVQVDGKILPCERIASHEEYFVIGDVENGISLEKVMNLYEDFDAPTKDDCKTCWCYRICSVGCLEGLVKGTLLDAKVKKRRCTTVRARRSTELVKMMELLERDKNALKHFDDVTVM